MIRLSVRCGAWLGRRSQHPPGDSVSEHPTVDLQALARARDKLVRLEFTDGYIVRARLVSVDLESPKEIIHEILEVVSQGPEKLKDVKSGAVVAADPAQLSAFDL